MHLENVLGKFPATRAHIETSKICFACELEYCCFPHCRRWSSRLKRFCACRLAAALQESCAAPFAFTLEPFAYNDAVPLTRQPRTKVADIPRCSECGAYINCFCGLDSIGWRCAVCGAYSEYLNTQSRRFGKAVAREQLPELQRQIYEFLCPTYDAQSVKDGAHALTAILLCIFPQHILDKMDYSGQYSLHVPTRCQCNRSLH
jgi:hypothetical protein